MDIWARLFHLLEHLTQTDPTHSQVFLYTFFYAGIIAGALYEMNKLTTKQNMWEDYSNGY